MASEEIPPGPGERNRIEWFTVRYRTLALAGLAALALAALAWVVLSPRKAPPAPATSRVETGARFSTFDGSVQVKRAGRLEWQDATKAMVLRQNDLVRTGPGGTAEIRFEDGSVFSVRPDSLITIAESTQNPLSREQTVSLSIESGEANFQTPARGVPGSTTITTPTVRTTAQRETAGSIAVETSGATGLRIFKGSGDVQTRSGQHVPLGPNEGVKVDAAGSAGAKVALPAVPQLNSPNDRSELLFTDVLQGLTMLTWTSVPGAASYRVVVDYSPSFARPLYDRRIQRPTQMELRGLETGDYFWRVAAYDAAGTEGAFSDVWRFTIGKTAAAAATPPPLSLETLEIKGNVLHVKGRSEAGATLTVNGEKLEVQADGSFEEYLTFEGGATAILVRATSARGGTAELRRRAVVVH
jgi:hypothetical protein